MATASVTGRPVRVQSSCASPSCGAARQLLPGLSRTWPAGREGADRRGPGSLCPGHLDPLGRRSGTGHGDGGHLQSQVSRLCGDIDERVQTFLSRPIEGEWPYVWLDATYVKARRDHHIVSVAVIVAVGVNTDGRREVLGMTLGHSEAEPFWVEFLRSLARRGLCGAKLVISDAHEGLKAAIVKVLGATWQRCRVHFMRNALAYAGKTQRRIVSAWVGTAFAQDDAAAARKQWREVADQARPRVPNWRH